MSVSAHFTHDELKCRGADCCGGKNLFDGAFLITLEAIRGWLDKPLEVTSGYRCPKYNALVAKTGVKGPHTTGRAVDVAIAGPDVVKLIRIALAAGITGLGIQQQGMGRFVHLDDLPDVPGCPRPRVWSY